MGRWPEWTSGGCCVLYLSKGSPLNLEAATQGSHMEMSQEVGSCLVIERMAEVHRHAAYMDFLWLAFPLI